MHVIVKTKRKYLFIISIHKITSQYAELIEHEQVQI